ncbi:hypothetical protein [Arundinibacter roseus]|uniref:Uncharacterized protein n=1 Tax=Arundinibacter roseus TaxID=2070510 RepID=A0A4R4K1N7_9BACT|nr:hypothetical protein [Arundinibacter roseus]TDB60422.1 hypothetical protein EZE20_21050 [Arundinibacter roseus]
MKKIVNFILLLCLTFGIFEAYGENKPSNLFSTVVDYLCSVSYFSYYEDGNLAGFGSVSTYCDAYGNTTSQEIEIHRINEM